MKLHIRISDSEICFATYEAGQADGFAFETYPVRRQASLTVNLRSAMNELQLPRQARDTAVEVHVRGGLTPVPLAEFQEEDAERTYDFCFSPEGSRRVFYDTVPACNIVGLFALSEATCRVLEDTVGRQIRYTSSLGAVVQHFATKGLANATGGKRIFVYAHDDVADIAIFEETRLITLNTYHVQSLSDIAYYTYNLAHHVGIRTEADPIFVAGPATIREPLTEELLKFAERVYPINPAAEFNRHPVVMTKGIPYDFVCALLK